MYAIKERKSRKKALVQEGRRQPRERDMAERREDTVMVGHPFNCKFRAIAAGGEGGCRWERVAEAENRVMEGCVGHGDWGLGGKKGGTG